MGKKRESMPVPWRPSTVHRHSLSEQDMELERRWSGMLDRPDLRRSAERIWWFGSLAMFGVLRCCAVFLMGLVVGLVVESAILFE